MINNLRASSVFVGLSTFAFLFTGCATVLPSSFENYGPRLQPEVFFSGLTHSWGILEARSGAPSRHLSVTGSGRSEPDGSFRLDQTVTLDGKVSRRSWVMRRVDAHHYEASLTDAGGVVRGEAYGNLFHLTYALKGKPGLTMEQWMYLQPDGRTVLNEDVVRAVGVTVLRLSEVITRDGPPVSSAPPP